MATKTKICEEEIEGEMEDRLSSLPHDLQIRILSSLDTKHAIQTSMLLKRWVSSWRWIPVLDFNSFSFHNYVDSPHMLFENLDVFDKFVDRVLRLRDPSAKLDRLTFHRYIGICSPKIIEDVFDYAFSHGVKQLEVYIADSCNGSWPVCLDASFKSVTSLKLQSGCYMSCSFLGPRSGSFKNLSVLYLEGAIITDLDPFSGFPVLESLTMVHCFITTTDGGILSVHARNLSDLTIWDNQNFNCCELTTPRLRLFDYRGCDIPLFRILEGLHVLDTMVISFNTGGCCMDEQIMFNNFLTLFCTIDNVKSLTLNWSIPELMSSFREELVKRSLPFRNLKCLKLNFAYEFEEPICSEIVEDAKVNLLQNSPDAEVIAINQLIYTADVGNFIQPHLTQSPRILDEGEYFDSSSCWESWGAW